MCVCVCVCVFFIPSSVDGCLGSFPILAIVNSAAINIAVHVSLKIKFLFFSDICPGVGLLDHMVALFLAFCGASILFSIAAVPIYILTNGVEGFPFPHTLSGVSYLWTF